MTELNIDIHVATEADTSAVVAILNDAKDYKLAVGDDIWGDQPYTDEYARGLINGGNLYVADVNGRSAATFILQMDDERMWEEQGKDGQAGYIHKLSTGRDFKGLGIGERAITWAGKKVRESGRKYLRLDCEYVNRGLCDYYERQGFHEVKKRDVPSSPTSRNPNIEVYRASLYQKEIF